MLTLKTRSPVGHRDRLHQIGVVIALLACVGLTGCTAAGTPPPASTAEVETVSPLPESGELDAGTYLVTGFAVPFEITVPDGWESGSWFVFRDAAEEARVAVNFQVPGYVPTDACAWKRALVEIDPSPAAFADAMAAQTSTLTTPARDITLSGFAGLEFDHSVESDVVIEECDEEKICLHSDSADNCGRYHSAVNEHETYRVVDLSGERAVIAVLSSGSVDADMAEEARLVFDSIEFDTAD